MLKNPDHDLLPSIDAIQDISKIIALQVGLAAIREGVAPLMDEASLQKAIEAHVWKPEYRDYRRITFWLVCYDTAISQNFVPKR